MTNMEMGHETSDAVDNRLKRDTFLYLDPEPPDERFAQCSTCRDWITNERCYIHRPDDKVPGSASCNLYVRGEPRTSGTPISAVTPEDSGLVDREVRCENCKWFDDGTCNFYQLLNTVCPDVFDLDTSVDEKGCCNANQARA